MLPVEAATDARPVVVAVKANPEPVAGSQEQQRKEDDGKATSSEPAK